MRPPNDPPSPDDSPRSRRVPTPEDLSAIDVASFLRRLDGSLAAIAGQATLGGLIPPDAAADALADPRFSDAERLFRSTLRGALVATSLGDLAAEAQVHPEVQRRLWGAMDEIDDAVVGVARALESLSADERAEIGRALRDEPELGRAVLAVLDAEAASAGVSDERRAHLRRTGEHACFRLRQSTPGFIADQAEKLAKVRPLAAGEAEKRLAARLGDAAFRREKDWHLAVAEAWNEVLAAERARLAGAEGDGGLSPDDAYAPPAAQGAPPPGPFNPSSGRTVLKVGAWLFGLGVFSGVAGGVLVSVHDDDVAVAGLFSFTAAAVLSIAGLICLLVGAILRARARSRARALAGGNP